MKDLKTGQGISPDFVEYLLYCVDSNVVFNLCKRYFNRTVSINICNFDFVDENTKFFS